MKRILTLAVMALFVLLHGCQPFQTRPSGGPPTRAGDDCRQALATVDRMVADAGTTDTSVFPVTGFPFLRTSRFLADAAQRENGAAATHRWLERMHALDLAARAKELRRLGDDQVRNLARSLEIEAERDALIAFAETCSRRLFDTAIVDPSLPGRVRTAASVPSEYRLWRRVAGLYPLVALPVAYVSAAAFDNFRQWHAGPPEDRAGNGRPVVYRPAGHGEAGRVAPERLFQATPMDALGLPLLSADAKSRLAHAMAPVLVQDEAAAYDRIGALRWREGRPAVAPADPTVYFYFSHARFDGRPSLQINYVFWYARRAGPHAPWIERGALDGLTVRISLDQTGRPVMLDIMNNCGCYHFFVPRHERIRRIKNPLWGLDPLVPAWLPPAFPERRLRLTVTSGWHQVHHVSVDRTAEPGPVYDLRPYAELEMLPDPEGQQRSIFDSQGIAYGSERIEPFIFFSMGIPDVGSMRQRGHHAIKLVGRAHFDDPLLFDSTFDYR